MVEQMRCDQENENVLKKHQRPNGIPLERAWILLPMIFSLRDEIRELKSNEIIWTNQ